MTGTGAPHLSQVPALDGLRGLDAVAVVVAHPPSTGGVLPWAPLGAVGVLVFFVLSGYVIA
jgi:peptidoglycan/LPS O-acetylase OafA/YrhL